MNKDKLKVCRAFAQAAPYYDDFAHLQRTVANILLEKVAIKTLQGNVLDIGCGTGYLTEQLQRIGGYQQLIALDIAMPMLQRAQQRLLPSLQYVCGDAEALPLQTGAVTYVFSSLALQWCDNLSTTLGDLRRVLKPSGTLAFATFGAQTLVELKQAWARVDRYRHINDFYTPQQLQALLSGNDWKNVQVTQQLYRPEYSSVALLLQELKGLGAQSVTQGRKPQLTGKTQMQQMMEAYPKLNDEGRIAASFEVVWVIAEAKA